ncbi:hypothetical protein [Alteromonas sp. 14N.309.X.WAT.G.H12]|uniref:hypothetical protein n=1 Tax=Alteromonas sp. 14N.309.X.WAT.G.H12 TaxID=3120824 RepID=UPI002FD5C5F2
MKYTLMMCLTFLLFSFYGEAQTKTVVNKPISFSKEKSGLREIGGDRFAQANAFLIIGNLSLMPDDLLNYIKQCRIDSGYHPDCDKVLSKLKRGLSVYRKAQESGELNRLANQLEAAFRAPVGETIIRQPSTPQTH